jgi:hypothetical protein
MLYSSGLVDCLITQKLLTMKLGGRIIMFNELVTVASYLEIVFWDSNVRAEGIHTVIAWKMNSQWLRNQYDLQNSIFLKSESSLLMTVIKNILGKGRNENCDNSEPQY